MGTGIINRMLSGLQREALAPAGFVLRLAKCSKCTRKDRRRAEQPPTAIPDQCAALQNGECLPVLGAHDSLVGDHAAEFSQTQRWLWAGFHSLRGLWARPGCLVSEVRILHLAGCPCFAWAAGMRHWTQWACRIACWFQRAEESWVLSHLCSRRTAPLGTIALGTHGHPAVGRGRRRALVALGRPCLMAGRPRAPIVGLHVCSRAGTLGG